MMVSLKIIEYRETGIEHQLELTRLFDTTAQAE
jgi:hypothetical protein